MAIVSVKELWENRGGEFDDSYKRSYTRTFRVRTDDERDGPLEVTFALGVPRIWDVYVSYATGEYDTLARCRRISPSQMADDPLIWEVRCEYETFTAEPSSPGSAGAGGGGGGDATKPGSTGPANNPEQRPPKIKWSFETLTRPLTLAYDNGGVAGVATQVVPVLNSAGQPFDPAPEYECAYPVYEVSRIETFFSPAVARQYAFAVNDDTFGFAAPGEAMCMPITADLVFIGGVPFWEVSYKIRFLPEHVDTFQPQILDAGYRQLNAGGTDLEDIFDPITRQPVSEPTLLDGAGRQLSHADLVANGAEYRLFYAYLRRPFAALNLPL